MFKASRSSSVRFGNLVFKGFNVLVVLAMLFQSFAMATPVQAKAVESQPEENNPVNGQPKSEEPRNSYQAPMFEHTQAIKGDHTLQEEVNKKSQEGASSPIMFIENVGQFDDPSRFVGDIDQGRIFVSDDSSQFCDSFCTDKTER